MEKYSNIPVHKIAITLKEWNAEINRGFADLIKEHIPQELLAYHEIDPYEIDYADNIRIGIWKARKYEGQTELVDSVRDALINHVMQGKIKRWLENEATKGQKISQRRFKTMWIRMANFAAREWYRPKALKRDPETTFHTPEEAEEIGKEQHSQYGKDILEDFIDELLSKSPLARDWINSDRRNPFRFYAMEKGYNPRVGTQVQEALVAILAFLLKEGYDKMEAADFLGYTGGMVSKIFKNLKAARDDFIQKYQLA